MDGVEPSIGGVVGSADAVGLLVSDDVDGSVADGGPNASSSTTSKKGAARTLTAGGIVSLASRLGGTSSLRGAGTSGDVDVEVDPSGSGPLDREGDSS